MNNFWLPLQGVPWAYLILAPTFSRGLRHQPRVAHAWSRNRFEKAVARAGGAATLRNGLWLDGVFMTLFLGATVPVLKANDGRWGFAVAAAGLDCGEAFILASILDREPQDWQTRLLAVVATGKLGAYAVATSSAVAAAGKLRD